MPRPLVVVGEAPARRLVGARAPIVHSPAGISISSRPVAGCSGPSRNGIVAGGLASQPGAPAAASAASSRCAAARGGAPARAGRRRRRRARRSPRASAPAPRARYSHASAVRRNGSSPRPARGVSIASYTSTRSARSIGSLAVAVDEPQVLERGDVPEVPDERAHQRRVDPLEVLVGDRRHQRQRPVPGLAEGCDHFRCARRRRCARAGHLSHCLILACSASETFRERSLPRPLDLVTQVQGARVLERPHEAELDKLQQLWRRSRSSATRRRR